MNTESITVRHQDPIDGAGQLDPTDPRNALGSPRVPVVVRNDIGFGKTQNLSLSGLPRDWVNADGSESWTVRGQHFFVSYTTVRGPMTLPVEACSDEYVAVVLAGSSHTRISADGHADQQVGEPSVVMVPPGASAVTVAAPGVIIRVFSFEGGRHFLHASNEAFYAQTDPRIGPFQRWPAPAEGYRLRTYPLAAAVPAPGIFGRIYRNSAAMVNLLESQWGPRDPDKLSPHVHPNFEQCTITVAGEYLHHCRTPWTPRVSNWRADEHYESPSPSITIIPPGVIHTSQAVGPGNHDLMDVFVPPRQDFSHMPGWVRNASDYPAPITTHD